MDKTKTPLSIKLSLAAVLIMIALPMLACMETVPPTPTADKPGTAQALSATEQALNLQATEKALGATQVMVQTKAAIDAQVNQTEEAKVVFTVKNHSNFTVCYVVFYHRISPEEENQDLRSINLPPNSSKGFSIAPGIYDLLAADCTEEIYAYVEDVNIPEISNWELTSLTPAEEGSQSLCGNGSCGSGENSSNCPQDCGSSNNNSSSTEPLCGNGVCGDFENPGNCPQDCGSGSTTKCGNGYCETGETAINCGYDCGFCPDGYCTGYENAGNCPQDCK